VSTLLPFNLSVKPATATTSIKQSSAHQSQRLKQACPIIYCPEFAIYSHFDLLLKNHSCFVEDNTIICFINIPIAKKKSKFSAHFWLSWIVEQVRTYCLPPHYTCLGCPTDCLPRQQSFF